MFSPESIYNDLRNAWKIALDHNETAQVLALTIPECGVKSANLDKRRDTVNSFILAHKENRLYVFLFFPSSQGTPYLQGVSMLILGKIATHSTSRLNSHTTRSTRKKERGSGQIPCILPPKGTIEWED